MSADALIAELSAIHPKGYDLSLDRIRRVLDRLGNPQDRMPPTLHVAGTNGKGSTVAFCRSILESAGLTVHVHTSPHLVDWRERYRMGAPGGGRLVTDNVLETTIRRVAQANGGEPITVFEILSAAMFLLFSENPADAAVVEVGLGGRFDATNVIPAPLVTFITAIGLDHEAWLGNTVEKIAFEKAGIIKPGRPVVVAPQIDSVREVIAEVAASRHAPAFFCGQDFAFHEQAGRFVYQDENGLLDLPMPGLRGRHQLANAATAIAGLRQSGLALEERHFEAGMEKVRWPGRFERLAPGHLTDKAPAGTELWIDGGHNPPAGEAVAAELRHLRQRGAMRVFLIAGMLTTKNPSGFFAHFPGLVDSVVTVGVPDSEAAFAPAELAALARQCGLAAEARQSVGDAMAAIGQWLQPGEPARILICGSLYLVGSVLRDNGTPPV